jgi:hypothetical protein
MYSSQNKTYEVHRTVQNLSACLKNIDRSHVSISDVMCWAYHLLRSSWSISDIMASRNYLTGIHLCNRRLFSIVESKNRVFILH